MNLITSNTVLALSKSGRLDAEYPYIATPFSATGPTAKKVMYDRYKAAVAISALLYQMNQPHYAPIVSTYPPRLVLKNPADSNFWVNLDKITLQRCNALWVVMLPGWASSNGIAREIEWWDELVNANYPLGMYQRPVRFYQLSSLMEQNLHNFQIRRDELPFLHAVS